MERGAVLADLKHSKWVKARDERLLPHDESAERAVIGCALEKPEYAEELDPSWFYLVKLEALAEKLKQMAIAHKMITVQTVVQAKHATVTLCNECLDACPASSSFDYWKSILLEQRRKRRYIIAANRFVEKTYAANGNIDAVVSEFEKQLAESEGTLNDVFDGRQCADKLVDHLEERFNLQGGRSGLSTGFRWFDNLTDGLQFGEQTLIAARPTLGKSAIAMNIVEKVCLKDQVPTLVVTLEMSATSLCRRMLSSNCRVPMGTLRSGKFDAGQFKSFSRFNSGLKTCPLFIVEGISGMDCDRLAFIVRRSCRKYGIKLVVIDYLQKIHASEKHEKRTYEVGEVSGVLKALAVETMTAFLTIAQLNREADKDKGRLPKLTDLADSGQIERDADTIALLHRKRDEGGGDNATLIIAKQRDGEVGTVELKFDGQFCKFTDADRDQV